MADHDRFGEHADPFCFRFDQCYTHKYIIKTKKNQSPSCISISNTTKYIFK